MRALLSLFLVALFSSCVAGSDVELVGCRQHLDCKSVDARWCEQKAELPHPTCVACLRSSHCYFEEARPLCRENQCWGTECVDDAGCGGATPFCDQGLCFARPPGVLEVVLDDSPSMSRCVDDPDRLCEEEGLSRWDVLRAVLGTAEWAPPSTRLGLLRTGGADAACGQPHTSLALDPDNRETWRSTWASKAFDRPGGGGSVAGALQVVDFDFRLLERWAPGLDRRVLLVTDGPPSCNAAREPPCTCAREEGCAGDDGALVPFGATGLLADPLACVDTRASLTWVEQLRAAGIRTAVVSLAPGHDDALASLAAAGGLANPEDPSGVYQAGDATSLRAAIGRVLAAE